MAPGNSPVPPGNSQRETSRSTCELHAQAKNRHADCKTLMTVLKKVWQTAAEDVGAKHRWLRLRSRLHVRERKNWRDVRRGLRNPECRRTGCTTTCLSPEGKFKNSRALLVRNSANVQDGQGLGLYLQAAGLKSADKAVQWDYKNIVKFRKPELEAPVKWHVEATATPNPSLKAPTRYGRPRCKAASAPAVYHRSQRGLSVHLPPRSGLARTLGLAKQPLRTLVAP